MVLKWVDIFWMIRKTEEYFIANYDVKELTAMKKDYVNFFKKREQYILTQIEDRYEKPVREMYISTQAAIRNMVEDDLVIVIFVELFDSGKDNIHDRLVH